MRLNKKQIISLIKRHSTALITSYIAWLTIYTYIPIKKTYQAPISFFNLISTDVIYAPEVVDVTIHASRASLDRIDPTIYIDAHTIPYNALHYYHMQQKDLFSPDIVNVVHYYPSVISITKKQNTL